VVRDVIRNLNLLGDSVTAGDCCLAGVKLSIVNTLTLGIIEAVAGEPVITVTSFILTTIGTIAAGLSIDAGTFKKTFVKAGLGCLLLRLGWQVIRIQEFVHDVLILADTVAEHATVITVVVNTPHNVNDITRCVSLDHLFAPVTAGLVVVDAHTGIVSAGSATANWGHVEIGPRGNRLEDGALGTCVNSSLNIVSQKNIFDAQFIQKS
jgi:hypothetical protein